MEPEGDKRIKERENGWQWWKGKDTKTEKKYEWNEEVKEVKRKRKIKRNKKYEDWYPKIGAKRPQENNDKLGHTLEEKKQANRKGKWGLLSKETMDYQRKKVQ